MSDNFDLYIAKIIMSTGKRPIFAGERKGIDINGGRKATAIASMARKAEQSLYNS